MNANSERLEVEEAFLALLGLDDLADAGEWVFEQCRKTPTDAGGPCIPTLTLSEYSGRL